MKVEACWLPSLTFPRPSPAEGTGLKRWEWRRTPRLPLWLDTTTRNGTSLPPVRRPMGNNTYHCCRQARALLVRAQCITKVELARRPSARLYESWPTRTFTPTLASSKRPSELWDEAWSKSLVPGSVSALRNLDPHPQREEAYLMAELGAEARKRQAGFRTDPLAASRCPRCGHWPGATSARSRGP